MEEGRRQEPNTLHGSRSFRPKTPSAWFLWTLPTGKAALRTGHPTPGTVSRPSDQGHLGPFPWMLPPWSCPGTPWTPTPPVPTGTSCSSPVGNFAPRSTLPAPIGASCLPLVRDYAPGERPLCRRAHLARPPLGTSRPDPRSPRRLGASCLPLVRDYALGERPPCWLAHLGRPPGGNRSPHAEPLVRWVRHLPRESPRDDSARKRAARRACRRRQDGGRQKMRGGVGTGRKSPPGRSSPTLAGKGEQPQAAALIAPGPVARFTLRGGSGGLRPCGLKVLHRIISILCNRVRFPARP